MSRNRIPFTLYIAYCECCCSDHTAGKACTASVESNCRSGETRGVKSYPRLSRRRKRVIRRIGDTPIHVAKPRWSIHWAAFVETYMDVTRWTWWAEARAKDKLDKSPEIVVED